VDATEHKELGQKYEVKGFPTLKLFKSGGIIDYNGGRTADAIVEYMVKKSGPAVTTIDSVADAEAFLAKHAKAAIGFFDDLEAGAAKGFTDYANKFDSLPLAFTKSKDVMVRAVPVSLCLVTRGG
jgi:protein disulfide-isomerase A1